MNEVAGGTHRVTAGLPTSRFKLLAPQVERILPVIVLSVAIFLRFYNLDTEPRGLSYDEAHNGVDALRILTGEWSIFLPENHGREALFVYLQAISVAFLGQTDLALRVVSAIIGILTIIATYPLTRHMFDTRVAMLTCGWLSISLWHVIFSRVGLRTILLPLLLAVGFYCLWRGLEGVRVQVEARHSSPLSNVDSPRPVIWFALGGIVIGLSLYTYSTARFAPFVIVALALYVALLHRQLLRQVLPGLVLALFLTTLIFLPEGFFFLTHPESFLQRAQGVWTLNPEIHKGNPIQALFDSAVRSLGMFAIRGDENWGHNISARPIFDPLSALLMLIGMALAMRRFREPAHGLIIIWLVVLFAPTFIAIDTPNHLRSTGLIPAIFMLPALGAVWLWEAWESRLVLQVADVHAGLGTVMKALPVFLVALAFLGGAFHTYHSYFGLWAKASLGLTWHFNSEQVKALEVAHSMARTEQKTILVGGGNHTLLPWMRAFRSDQPEAQYIRTFDAKRSIIFPTDQASYDYLFPPDLPPKPILNKYFDEESAQIVATAPSGQPITLYRLLSPRPSFEPALPVPARFGDQVFVYGFDLPKDVRAGEIMTVRWYWRILATDEREFAFTNQLFGEDGHRRGQVDDRGFASDYWPTGTSGISTFEILVFPEAPTGAYWLHVAIYERFRHEVPNLPIFDSQGQKVGNHLRLGPIKVHGRPMPAPAVENHLPASFADQIDLLGYSLSDNRLVPGESHDLTLFWSPRGRPSRDYTVFVHLLDSQGLIQGQADSPPRAGRYPTSVWDSGEVIADLHTFSLRPDLPDGEYRLRIGLYDPETGKRVEMVDENGQMVDEPVIISGLAVDRRVK